jgi:hypothetical protein
LEGEDKVGDDVGRDEDGTDGPWNDVGVELVLLLD